MRLIRIISFTQLFFACVLGAAPASERVLVPIATNTPGQNGSLWSSYIQVYNGEASLRSIDFNQACPFECTPNGIPPRGKKELDYISQPPDAPGMIVYVDSPADAVTFYHRIQDQSRQAATYGTEIPVVRETSFYSAPIHLLAVPTSAAFRHAVRIYSMDQTQDARVRVNVLGARRETLGSFDLTLQIANVPAPFLRYKPLYAQILDLSAIAGTFGGYANVDVELIPLSAGMRFWAFVSVTNNDTQHVTTITPHERPGVP